MPEIRKVTVYQTDDGQQHPSMLLANHHLQVKLVYRLINTGLELADEKPSNHVAAHIVNMLCSNGNRDEVRKLLDLVERMEKELRK